jgi:hypothetical protein
MQCQSLVYISCAPFNFYATPMFSVHACSTLLLSAHNIFDHLTDFSIIFAAKIGAFSRFSPNFHHGISTTMKFFNFTPIHPNSTSATTNSCVCHWLTFLVQIFQIPSRILNLIQQFRPICLSFSVTSNLINFCLNFLKND